MNPNMRSGQGKRRFAAVAVMALLLASRAGFADERAVPESSTGITTSGGDVYRAGLIVDAATDVNGDVVAAGGDVRIDGRITGDLTAAGARLHVAGRVGDDARLAGGTVSVDARIGDHLMLAGNTVELWPASEIAHELRVAGDHVDLDGHVHGPVEVAADTVRIRGRLDSDVRVTAERVEVGPGARIDGNLRYRADAPATVADGARIGGELLFERNAPPRAGDREGPDADGAAPDAPSLLGIGTLVLWVASALLAAMVLNGLFPGFVRASERTAVEKPWQSLGVGLLTLAAVPVVVILLIALVVTLPLGLTVMALAPVAVLVGYLLFAFVLTERMTRLVGAHPSRTSRRLLWLTGILLVLALIQRVPTLGSLLLAAAVVFGTGAGLVALTCYRQYGSDVMTRSSTRAT